MTARVGLIGHPLDHSISPHFQQAAFDALGIDARYDAWDLPPEQLQDFIAGPAPARRARRERHHPLQRGRPAFRRPPA